jgi:hypothetical protein
MHAAGRARHIDAKRDSAIRHEELRPVTGVQKPAQ